MYSLPALYKCLLPIEAKNQNIEMLKSDLDEAEKKLYESNLAFENEKDKNENLLSIIEDLKAELAKYTADLKAELEKTADLFKEKIQIYFK